jgi:hypothetical protein
MTLRPTFSQSGTDQAAIQEYLRLHKDEVADAAKYAESQGLKPKPQLPPSSYRNRSGSRVYEASRDR